MGHSVAPSNPGEVERASHPGRVQPQMVHISLIDEFALPGEHLDGLALGADEFIFDSLQFCPCWRGCPLSMFADRQPFEVVELEKLNGEAIVAPRIDQVWWSTGQFEK